MSQHMQGNCSALHLMTRCLEQSFSGRLSHLSRLWFAISTSVFWSQICHFYFLICASLISLAKFLASRAACIVLVLLGQIPNLSYLTCNFAFDKLSLSLLFLLQCNVFSDKLFLNWTFMSLILLVWGQILRVSSLICFAPDWSPHLKLTSRISGAAECRKTCQADPSP